MMRSAGCSCGGPPSGNRSARGDAGETSRLIDAADQAEIGTFALMTGLRMTWYCVSLTASRWMIAPLVSGSVRYG